MIAIFNFKFFPSGLQVIACIIAMSIIHFQRANAVRTNFTKSEIEKIVGAHNLYRGQVQPTARNMRQMTWDKKLASMAQDRAERCIYSHGVGVIHPVYGDVGENIYITEGFFPNSRHGVERSVEKWNEEVNYFDYDSQTCREGKTCGHYTQLIWSSSHLVGCGKNYCPGPVEVPTSQGTIRGSTMIFCLYHKQGNKQQGLLFNKQIRKPYLEGESCSNCPKSASKCVSNLCAKEKVIITRKQHTSEQNFTVASGADATDFPAQNYPQITEAFSKTSIKLASKNSLRTTTTFSSNYKHSTATLRLPFAATLPPSQGRQLSTGFGSKPSANRTDAEFSRKRTTSTKIPLKKHSTNSFTETIAKEFSHTIRCYSCLSTAESCKNQYVILTCNSQTKSDFGLEKTESRCMIATNGDEVKQDCATKKTCHELKKQQGKQKVNCCATDLCNSVNQLEKSQTTVPANKHLPKHRKAESRDAFLDTTGQPKSPFRVTTSGSANSIKPHFKLCVFTIFLASSSLLT